VADRRRAHPSGANRTARFSPGDDFLSFKDQALSFLWLGGGAMLFFLDFCVIFRDLSLALCPRLCPPVLRGGPIFTF